MSVVWVLLVAATGASPANSSTVSSNAVMSNAVMSNAANASSQPAAKAAVEPAGRSAKELRQAVTEALHRAKSGKVADRAAVVMLLVDLFNELGQDRQLSPPERQRIGAEIRSRLQRFAMQFRHELSRSAQRAPAQSEAGASGGLAAEGPDDLVDLIQKTIGPQDWVLAQRIGGPGGAGQPAAGLPGQGARAAGGSAAGGSAAGGSAAGGGAAGGGAFGGGAFGGGLEQQTQANGDALVDLIQTTIAPDSWEIRGGPGTIVYFNPFRVLVVRQTGDVHDNLSDLLGGLRR